MLLKEFIEMLSYQQLLQLREELRYNAIGIDAYIEKKLSTIEHAHRSCCATCGNTVQSEIVKKYSLVFGPDDFKKKASFCGVDCLQTFTKRLHKIETLQTQQV